jgi:hypothetical protein
LLWDSRLGRGALALLVTCAGLSLVRAQEGPPPDAASPEEDVVPDATGYIEMPASTDGTYLLGSAPGSGHNFGKPEFIRHLALVAREWHRRHPDLPRICIGDMSHRDASDFPPHKTHKDGLTADIVTKPVNICHIKYENHEHQIELAELFVAYGARQILFNGDAVVQKVKVAQKYELHDDHFHVVVDPKRVPEDGKVFVAPEADRADGAVFGGAELDKEGKGLKLRWLVLGGAERVKSFRVWFDDTDDENGVLWDPGAQKAPRAEAKPGEPQASRGENCVRVPLAVEDGKRYRWKLELELASGEKPGFGWQLIRADLLPPVVSLEGPADGAPVERTPRLEWRFEKSHAEQATFAIELSDKKGGRILATIGPLPGKETAFVPEATPFEAGRHYAWRVRASDAHGNEAVTDWRAFKVASSFRFVPPSGTARAACSMLAADGSVAGKLKKGDEVLVVGEVDTRYVVAAASGKAQGFVARSAIEVKAPK